MKTILPSAALLCLLSLGTCHSFGQDYTWDTIAGSPGLSGKTNGTNSDARFNTPSCLAVDTNGIIYVSDTANRTIRKIQPSGSDWIVTTIAGLPGSKGSADGTNTDARFNTPNGIVLGPTGEIFVVDHSNYIIRRIVPEGTNYVVSTIAGKALQQGSQDGVTGESTFANPTGIALDSQGNLIVSDTSNHSIRRLAPSGDSWLSSTVAGDVGTFGFTDEYNRLAQFNLPYCVTVDGASNIYVADFGNNAIRQITPIGSDWLTTTIAGNTNNIDPGSADGPGDIAMFNTPNGIAVDASGTLYVTDQSNHTIRKITKTGTSWTVSTIGGFPGVFGTADGLSDQARFKKPFGITVDAKGVLYVADFSNHTIRRGIPQGGTAPTIQLITSGGELFLAWPALAGNYVLETSSTLLPNGNWTPITEGIVVSGENLTWKMVPGAGSAFYRLHQE